MFSGGVRGGGAKCWSVVGQFRVGGRCWVERGGAGNRTIKENNILIILINFWSYVEALQKIY